MLYSTAMHPSCVKFFDWKRICSRNVHDMRAPVPVFKQRLTDCAVSAYASVVLGYRMLSRAASTVAASTPSSFSARAS